MKKRTQQQNPFQSIDAITTTSEEDAVFEDISKKGEKQVLVENIAKIRNSFKEIRQTQSLVYLGFIILLVMVATMILMVITMFLDTQKEKRDVIYVEKGEIEQKWKTEIRTNL